MKKFLSLTLTAAILLATLVVGVVSASAQTFDTAIKVGTTTYVADVGDTFTYTVLLKSDRPLATGQFELPVNFAYLSGDSEDYLNTYIDETMPVVGNTGLVQRFDTASAWNLKGYVLNFATGSSYDFSSYKVAFTLNFTVLQKGTISLTPNLCDFVDSNGNDMINYDGKVVAGSIETSIEVGLAKQNNYTVKAPRITSFSNTADGIRVNWNKADGAGQYRVFRKNDGKWSTLGTVTTTSFEDKNVTSGSAYTYTVRAMDASGKSYVSDYVTAGWTSTYIGQPAVTAFDSLADGLKLTWGTVNGAAAYRVYRHNGSKWETLADTAANSYVDTNVTAGTQYKYTVRCLNNKNALVSSYNTTGFSAYYLGAPVMKSVGNYDGYVAVNWYEMKGAEKYRVFRKTADTGWYKIADTTAFTYKDKVVDSGTTYTYTVRCISADGKTYTSVYDTKGMTIKYVAAPAISKFENTTAGTVITWGKVEGAENYRVFRKNGTSWKKLGDTTGNTFTDKGLKSGTKYTYTVRCVNADSSAFTSAYNATGWTNTYLTAPTVSSVGNYVGYVRVNWAKMTGAAKYRVFRKTGSGSWTKLGDTTGVYWNDKTAKSGTKYSYTVRCISSDGKTYTSPYNNGKTITYIAAPTLKSVAKVTGGVKLTWAKSTGAVKYRVFRKTGSGNWQKLGDTTAVTWTDKTVKSGTKYSYTVRCITSDGKSFTSAYNTAGLTITYK